MVSLTLSVGLALSALVALAARKRVAFLTILTIILLSQNVITMIALRTGDIALQQGSVLLAAKESTIAIAVVTFALLRTGAALARGRVGRNVPLLLPFAFVGLLLVWALASSAPLLLRLGGLRSLAIMPALFILGYWIGAPRQRVAALGQVMVIAAIFVAIFGLLEAYVLPADFWLRIGHEEYYLMKRGRPVVGELYGNMRFWIAGEPVRRVASITGDPLVSSYWLAFALLVITAPILLRGRVRPQVIPLIVLFTTTLVLTLSRGAAVTVAVAMTLLALTRRRTAVFLTMSVLGLVTAGLIAVVVGPSLLRITYGAGHVDQLRDGLVRGLNQPLGYGLGVAGSVASGLARARDARDVLVAGGDSFVGGVSTQIGIVGLVLWAATMLGIAATVHKAGALALRSNAAHGELSIVVAAFAAALVITATVNESGLGFTATGPVFLIAGQLLRAAPVGVRRESEALHGIDSAAERVTP